MKKFFDTVIKNFSNLRSYSPIITTLLFFDQLTKWLVRNNFNMFESKQITSFLALTYTTNTGVAFGMFEGNNNFFIISNVIILFLLIVSVDSIIKDFGDISVYSVILIISGGLGNLIDRIFLGRVTDFIDIQINYKNVWPIFNFADSYVFIGVWILVICFVLNNFKLKFKKNINK